MPSVTDICNGALQKLGAKKITDIDDPKDKNALACKNCYSRLRDKRLQSHPWAFAIERAQLSANVTAPLFGVENQFPLPADFLRLLPPDERENWNDLDRRIEGRKIVTDEGGPLNIRYVKRVLDPNDMDPLFMDVLMCDMALEMSEEFTQSNQKKQVFKDDRKTALDEAKRTGAIQKPPAKPSTDTWESCRQ